LEDVVSASQEPGQLQQQQQLQSPLALSLSHDISSLQHQVHQLQATCTLLEQQQQAVNTSTTAVASTIPKFEQRMQQLEQQGQRQLSSSKAADSAVVQRLQALEQQVACLADSAAETQVMLYLCACLEFALCSSAMSTVAAAAMHEDQPQVAVQLQN
jgi:chromosome segregation ATPase